MSEQRTIVTTHRHASVLATRLAGNRNRVSGMAS
jgi:hypothetical protein